MESYLKEFTVVDFLGILVPGCTFILLESFMFSSSGIWSAYFGTTDNALTRGIILIVAGYIVGAIFHEAADWIVRVLWMLPIIKKLSPMRLAAKIVGHESIKEACDNLKFPSNLSEKSKDSQNDEFYEQALPWIRAYMANQSGESKIRLFQSFYISMRNLFLVTVIFCGINWTQVNEFVSDFGKTVFYLAFLAVGFVLVRAYHYHYLSFKYLLENFYNRQNCQPQSEKPLTLTIQLSNQQTDSQ